MFSIKVNLNVEIFESVVAVAQSVESRIVIPVVVGSSPISHPIIPLLNQRVRLKRGLNGPNLDQ